MKLGELCILFTDGDWIESKDQSDSGIRLIQTGNIGNGEFLYKNDKAKYISVDTFKRLNCKEVFPNDILVSRLPEPVGRGCIIPDIGEKMITAVDCTICRINENLVDRKYFCYFLESNAYKTQLEQHVTGTTRKRISRKNLSSVEIDIPEQAKQKEVVYKLDRLKKIIQNYNRELDLLDELVRARFVEMFGTLHDNENRFNIVTIEEVCSIIKDGTHQTPHYTEDKINGYKFLSSKDVMSQKIDWKNIKYIPKDLHEKLYASIQPQRNDILMSKNGVNYGVAAVNDTNEVFDIYVSLALLRPKQLIDPVFFRCVINSIETKRQFDMSIKGIGVPNLHLGEIKKTKIILPPMVLQKQFVTFVKQIDKSRSRIQKSLEASQELFDSLMQEYFG